MKEEKQNENTKYIIIGVLVVIIVILAVMVFTSTPTKSNSGGYTNYTGERTQLIQSYQNINEAKSCEKDKECALSECSGCFSKDFLDKGEPELPCSKFMGYTCICERGQCTEIK